VRVETHLCREYEAWCADNKLPHMPADELSVELDYARDVTDDVRKIDRITRQLQWLATFIKRGAAGQVAMYTERWHHLSLMRRILLRMRSWENYLFLEGH
jgi:hypothetical protein